MAGEDQQDTKPEKVALPPPTKRRDHHLRKLITNIRMRLYSEFLFF